MELPGSTARVPHSSRIGLLLLLNAESQGQQDIRAE